MYIFVICLCNFLETRFVIDFMRFQEPLQAEKTGKTIGGYSKIKVFDTLEKMCWGIASDPVLKSFWRQVGSKSGFGRLRKQVTKNHEKHAMQI